MAAAQAHNRDVSFVSVIASIRIRKKKEKNEQNNSGEKEGGITQRLNNYFAELKIKNALYCTGKIVSTNVKYCNVDGR